MTAMIERMARAICAADKTAPDPDASILIGMRAALAVGAVLALDGGI